MCGSDHYSSGVGVAIEIRIVTGSILLNPDVIGSEEILSMS